MRNRGILSFLALSLLALGTVSLFAQETQKELLPVWDLEKVSVLVNQDKKPVSFAIERREAEPRDLRDKASANAQIPRFRSALAPLHSG